MNFDALGLRSGLELLEALLHLSHLRELIVDVDVTHSHRSLEQAGTSHVAGGHTQVRVFEDRAEDLVVGDRLDHVAHLLGQDRRAIRGQEADGA